MNVFKPTHSQSKFVCCDRKLTPEQIEEQSGMKVDIISSQCPSNPANQHWITN